MEHQLPVIPGRAEVPVTGTKAGRRLPSWLRKRWPAHGDLPATTRIVGRSKVATVCQEAHCPNRMECWSRRTATFMILGDRCTRRCHFCAVQTARPEPPDPGEPERLAIAAAELGIRHVVITSVARDDLPDEGAEHFAECVRRVRAHLPEATVEVLPADLHAKRELIAVLCDAEPDIYNHNIETVERLTPAVRPQGKYRRSLEVLRTVKTLRPRLPTKSGLMVGLGETPEEIHRTLADLRDAGCDMVTIGQYLAPSARHTPVARFIPPAEFDDLAQLARELGFASAACGPFVRSSYNAAEVFKKMTRSSSLKPHEPSLHARGSE
jgi:lipoic acid synthetase